MKIDDCWGSYESKTGSLSTILRHAAFASLAVIWVFRSGDAHSGFQLDESLARAGLFVFSGMIADALQYLAGTIFWHTFCAASEYCFKKAFEERKTYLAESSCMESAEKEAEINAAMGEAEFCPPSWINWPANTLFYLKTVLYLIGFSYIIHFLYTCAFAAVRPF